MLAKHLFYLCAGLLCLGATRASGQAGGGLAPVSMVPADARAEASEPEFRTYEEAISYVRSHYRGENHDTSRSSWITSAEYFHAKGRGYLILGMRGRPYIFARVPRAVWEGFKEAPSFGRYYHQHIKGRYPLKLR